MLDDRFWAKVDKSAPSGCWVWLANRNNKGYGLFRPGGTAGKQLAHRLSFAETYGAIPPKRLVLHSCDNPRCVNPAHLRLGDHRENTKDMDARGRRVTNARRGETNPASLLSDAEVSDLRSKYVSGVPFSDLVETFSLPLASIKEYCWGKSFAHLYGRPGHPSREAMKAEAAKRRRNGAKISKGDAEAIRAALDAGETGRSVAARYGIHPATVSDIKLRKIWP